MNATTDVESIRSGDTAGGIQLSDLKKDKDDKCRESKPAVSQGPLLYRLYTRLVVSSCFVVNHKLSNKNTLFFLLTLAVWVCCLVLFGAQALPGGGVYFSLIVLFLSAHSLGFLFELVKLPSLLGMLITGIIFKNVPAINVVGLHIDSQTSSVLR